MQLEQITTYAHARDALKRKGATKAQLRDALTVATDSLRQSLGPGVRKVDAARLLGISRQALDTWIARGRIRTVPASKPGRVLVDADDLAELILEVNALRRAGTDRTVVSRALHQLAQRDPKTQTELQRMLAPGLAAMERGDLIPATVPDTFGPDD